MNVNLLKQIKIGFSTYFKSFGFIRDHGMWKYYLYPLVFIILFGLFAGFSISTANDYFTPLLSDWLSFEEIPGEGWWEISLNFLKDAGKYLIGFLIWVSFALIYYKISKYVVLIFLSPVMAFVSERTEKELTAIEVPFVWSQFIKDVARGVIIAIRNLFVEIGIIIVLGVMNLMISLLFPPAAIITTPLIAIITFLVGAYYYGFSTMDYTSERRKLSVGESIKYIRKNKGVAIANGSIFTLWLIIPILGTYIGTIFAPITCTVGATLAIHELDKEDEAGVIEHS